jgi:SAM-dependent methyltransferase
MEDIAGRSANFYTSDDYIRKNPTLHEEDSPWKVGRIIPMVDSLIEGIKKQKMTILDVGGGAGLILNHISEHIEKEYAKMVEKYAIDLSPGMLDIQKKNNPDLKLTLNEDIGGTSLSDKQIDLALMIDVLEHIPESEMALRELRRISNFVIFKVPLENCAQENILNLLSRGRRRKNETANNGHVNFYSMKELRRNIEKNTGIIMKAQMDNAYLYYRNSAFYWNSFKHLTKIRFMMAIEIFKISPRLVSFLVPGSVTLLVKCY